MERDYIRSRQAMLKRQPAIDQAGFSVIELVTVLAVSLILAAMAVPLISSSTSYFALRSAVSSTTGAIQSTRYRAIFDGCPYQLTLSKATDTYQIASETTGTNTCAPAFTNVGGAVPFSTSQVVLDRDVTLQFKPGGIVQATAGAMTFTLSYGANVETITVTNYGNITIKP